MYFLSTIHPQVITIEMHSYSQDNHMFILRFIRLSIENLTIITIIITTPNPTIVIIIIKAPLQRRWAFPQ